MTPVSLSFGGQRASVTTVQPRLEIPSWEALQHSNKQVRFNEPPVVSGFTQLNPSAQPFATIGRVGGTEGPTTLASAFNSSSTQLGNHGGCIFSFADHGVDQQRAATGDRLLIPTQHASTEGPAQGDRNATYAMTSRGVAFTTIPVVPQPTGNYGQQSAPTGIINSGAD